MCVWSGTPEPARQRRRLAHQPVADGERRARPDGDPDHAAVGGVVMAPDGILGVGEDGVGVLDDVVGRQPSRRLPDVHGAAARVQAQPDGGRGIDLGGEQVPRAAREQVVVIGAGRAAREGQLGQPHHRAGPHPLGVQARPHRIQRAQPVEQARLRGEPARHRLVQVVMRVDEAGRGHQARGRRPPRRPPAPATAPPRFPPTRRRRSRSGSTLPRSPRRRRPS